MFAVHVKFFDLFSSIVTILSVQKSIKCCKQELGMKKVKKMFQITCMNKWIWKVINYHVHCCCIKFVIFGNLIVDLNAYRKSYLFIELPRI